MFNIKASNNESYIFEYCTNNYLMQLISANLKDSIEHLNGELQTGELRVVVLRDEISLLLLIRPPSSS